MSAAERIKAEARSRIFLLKRAEKLAQELRDVLDADWDPPESVSDASINESICRLLVLIERAPFREG